MVSGVEMEIYRPDGGRVFVRATAAPVRSPAGELIAAVMILDDWTEERRAKQDMLRAVRVRDDMLAVVSHDLRNPIHAVGVAIDELADPALGEPQLGQPRLRRPRSKAAPTGSGRARCRRCGRTGRGC